MIKNIDENLIKNKVGDILNTFPHTKYFFDKYNIDYCCGGQNTLEKALNENNINNANILNELINEIKNRKPSSSDNEIIKSTDLSSKSNTEIVNFIVNHFHEGLRETLPKINQMLLKAMRAHIKNHKELFWKIHELLGKVIVICESHLILEEEEIFKQIIKYEQGLIKHTDEDFTKMTNAIMEAIKEHDTLGPTLKELQTITNNYTPPQDACCDTVKSIYEELQKLQEHLMAHTQVENNILFPKCTKQ